MTDLKPRLQELTAKLKARGGRVTPQRMAIVKVLLASEDHPSADEVYERVRADFPMISLATVYKTVALLKELDEVLEIEPVGSGSHYDGFRPYEHPHIICRECGRVMDVDLPELDALRRRVSASTGDWHVGPGIHFYGVCAACQRRDGESEERR